MHATLHTLQLVEPFRIAHGASTTRTVLRLHREGLVTEAPFVPYYGDDPAEALALLDRGELDGKLPRTLRLAINLIEHETAARAAWRPLSAWAQEKLGAPTDFIPPGCRSLGIPEDLESFAGNVATISRQFRVLKLKLGSGDLGLDLAIVAVARRAAPEAELILDVNGGWDPSEAPMMITKLMDYHPTLVEQPIHHRHPAEAWRILRGELPEQAPPLYADESIQTAADIAPLAAHLDGVNVKLLKCGSFDGAVETISVAREHGLGVLLGCMIESSLGTTAAAHLAPWADWIDLDGHLHISNDDYAGIEYADDGSLVMPNRAGIGAAPR